MTEPAWLTVELIRAVHQEMIAEHGGMGGIRDEGLLESALARPQQLLAYGNPDVFELATAYASGIVRNHPFVDGNKRTGFMAAFIFPRLHGYRLVASEVEAVVAFQDLAAGEIDEAMLAKWIETNTEPV